MKQDAQLTAVEWFNQQLVDRQNGNGDSRSRDEIFEQAKAMENKQKIEFACAVYDKYNFGPQEISFREECEQFKSE